MNFSNPVSASEQAHRALARKKFLLIIATALSLFGVLFSLWTGKTEDELLRINLMNQAQIAMSALDQQDINQLQGAPDDVTNPHYLKLKSQLMQMRDANPRFRFLYLMRQNPDGQIVLLLDSEPPDSPDMSPPGQIYEEAPAAIFQVLQQQNRVAHGPYTDRWGTWVSAFLPMIDPASGKIYAIYGMDVDSGDWWRRVFLYSALPVTVALLMSLLVVLIFALYQRAQREKNLISASAAELQRLENIVSSSNDLMSLVDRNYTFLIINDAYLRIFGKSREEIVGHTLADLYGEDFFHTYQKPVFDRCLTGITDGYEAWFQLPAGRRYLNISYTPYVEKGEIAGLVVTSRDLTERKLHEENELKKSLISVQYGESLYTIAQHNYESLQAHLHAITETGSRMLRVYRTSVWRLEKNILDCHDQYTRLSHTHESGLKYSLQSDSLYVESLSNRKIIDAEDACADPRTREFRDQYRKEQISSILDVPVWQEGRLVGVLAFDHTGARRQWSALDQEFATHLATFVSLAFEAEDRRRAFQTIRAGEVKYRMLLETQRDGVFVSQDYQFKYANQALPDMLGYSIDEFLGLPFDAVIAPEFLELWTTRYEQRIGTGPLPPSIYEVRFLCKGGNKDLWIEVNAQRYEYEGRPAVFGVVRDLTERKLAEAKIIELNESLELRVQQRTAELNQANVELELARNEAIIASQAKSAFLSRMSHELRTPLHAILGFSQLLESGSGDFTADEKNAVSQIHRSGLHLMELINEVLDLTRIETGKLDMLLEDINLDAGLSDECYALVRPMAEKNQVTLQLKKDSVRPVVVYADRMRLKQVLLNLLSNAIKYNRPGGSVTLSYAVSNKKVNVTITDTGMGIPESQQARIFTPFFRVQNQNSTIEGTGIGLTICQTLVKAMGGNIGFTSVTNRGSTFWLELRAGRLKSRHKPKPVAEKTDLNTELHAAQAGNTGKVLYIEDTEANVQLMRLIIKRMHGIELLDSNMAETGITLAQESHPDLILMDIDLPGMDGIDALQVLRTQESTRNIPVIAVTAATMPHDMERIRNAGFDDFLSKPFDIRSLPAFLSKHLGHQNSI